jgi:hypothetical protein
MFLRDFLIYYLKSEVSGNHFLTLYNRTQILDKEAQILDILKLPRQILVVNCVA